MFRVTLRVVFPVFLVILSVVGLSGPVQAEPQILGVVATSAPIPMRCENGECTANLATFCLEPDRYQPSGGDAYRPADTTKLQITRLDAQGQPVIIDTPARYQSDYYYTSIQVVVPEAAVGDGALFITALPGAALLPVPAANDENLHTPDQISQALGQARSLASAYFENGDPDVEGAQLLNRALSLLPPHGRVADAERERIWQSTLKSSGQISAKGKARGADLYETCEKTADLADYYTMRGCLKRQNRQLLVNPNAEFWRLLKTGS